ncbi:MAG: DUF2071 domain-containing protein [Planctomycetes bacterium]|nr:DUF2071 domain-containing protein [Planctomycetota bacterium]
MFMNWHDLLFAHWPVRPEALRPHVPPQLAIETFDGRAYLGVVPFHMTGVRRRGLPRVPTTHAFCELNVRTYVTDGRKRGVWFFSLDAPHRLPIFIARRWYGLNYVHAAMRRSVTATGAIRYASKRRRDPTIGFEAEYAPTGSPFIAAPGSLDHFLVERYCLYSVDRSGRLRRGDIVHEPWRLQRATARIAMNTMTRPLDVELAGEPHLMFAKLIEARAWAPRGCDLEKTDASPHQAV